MNDKKVYWQGELGPEDDFGKKYDNACTMLRPGAGLGRTCRMFPGSGLVSASSAPDTAKDTSGRPMVGG